MFSVIVPTYNRPETLKKLLQSLEKQTFSKELFEVIVVYSQKDTSESFLSTFKTTFKLVPLCIEDKEFNGKSASIKRNCGVQKAQYSWLAFTDDDCVSDSDWLANASKVISSKKTSGIEGKTVVPHQEKQTFTAKGMAFLSQFGGYQTCNMFYEKEAFLKIGGFDSNLPFYLEDTDMAWSFLEKDLTLTPAENVVVTHPVPEPNVYRWIENAIRTRKIPYLAKKHPLMFKKTNFKALSKSSLIMALLFIGIFIVSIATLSLNYLMIGLGCYLLLSSLYVLYLLRDCTFQWRELLRMFLFFPLIPPISFFQLLRGNIEQRTFVI